MIDGHSDQSAQLRRKYWGNLVVLLRGKLATLEGLDDAQVEELFDNEIYVTSGNSVLSVWLDAESGEGSWNSITVEQTVEPWFMSVYGTIKLGGEVIDIESAASLFAMKLKTN